MYCSRRIFENRPRSSISSHPYLMLLRLVILRHPPISLPVLVERLLYIDETRDTVSGPDSERTSSSPTNRITWYLSGSTFAVELHPSHPWQFPLVTHPCQLASRMIVTQVPLSQSVERFIYQNKLSEIYARIFNASFPIMMTTVAFGASWAIFNWVFTRLSCRTSNWRENSLTRVNFCGMSHETVKKYLSTCSDLREPMILGRVCSATIRYSSPTSLVLLMFFV
ncbi:hypothetical protein BC827DRAFT_320639 [Russula dissimulans]|nr:hypothetical protein BC827DRAFT_320639 [Russula dissimulans]